MKKRFFFINVIISTLILMSCVDSAKPRLGVVDFSISDPQNSKLVNDSIAFRNMVQSNIVELGQYYVIDNDEIDTILRNQVIYLSSISSSESLRKLKQMNISYLVIGSVETIDNYYQISISILDVTNGCFVFSDDEFMENTEREVDEGIKTLGNRLTEALRNNTEQIIVSQTDNPSSNIETDSSSSIPYYVELGIKAYNEEDYNTAFECFSKADTIKDPEAQLCLGRMYALGYGVTQSYEKAFEWFTKSASQGNTKSQNNLGIMYRNGDGVMQSYAKAFEWYTKAANQGSAEAQFSLGVMYALGDGVSQNYEKAAEWYTKAANQGFVDAQFNLGNLYYRGDGVTKSYKKAIEWYKKAANQGDADAEYSLGFMYDNGYGVIADEKKAGEWFMKSANHGNAYAQLAVGVMYQYGYGVTQSLANAIEWYEKAAAQGNQDAINVLNNLK
ncbi:MAG: sel1 repeat family protein [Spirochaetaceae bacterium]|nr:sel1 repeat family protein [Spirochaetaceae bacterium]